MSIHVPAPVVKRVLRWLWQALPPLSLVLTAGGLTWRFGAAERIPYAEFDKRVAPAQAAAKAAQSDAHHAASLADTHAVQLEAAWREIVQLHADVEVLRSYSRTDGARRAELINSAREFYLERFNDELAKHKLDPAEAARIAMLQTWRPDR